MQREPLLIELLNYENSLQDESDQVDAAYAIWHLSPVP